MNVSFKFGFWLILSYFNSFMQDAIAIDYLDESGPVKISFTISDRIGSDRVSASVTFSAKGLQPVHPTGEVSINGIPLVAKQLQRQGYWYPLDIPKAAKYQLRVKRSGTASESVHTIFPREFIPHIPLQIARSADVIVRYDGPLIANPGELFITLGTRDSEINGAPWEITPKPTVAGNRIIIAARDIARAKSTRANLYVGISWHQQQSGSGNRLTYAVGQTAEVTITD